MKLWHGHFIGNFKSPTCPDVPGGKEKNFTTTLQSCRGIVAFDLIWPELAVFCFPSLWSPLCAWGKKLFYNHWPGMFPGTCWTKIFFEIRPHTGPEPTILTGTFFCHFSQQGSSTLYGGMLKINEFLKWIDFRKNYKIAILVLTSEQIIK